MEAKDMREAVCAGVEKAMAGSLEVELQRALDLERIKRKELLAAAEVEALYGFKVTTLATWRCRGGGPDFFKRGGTIFYRARDLAKFVADRIVKGR